jgi:lysophospholipase L1-like esterase
MLAAAACACSLVVAELGLRSLSSVSPVVRTLLAHPRDVPQPLEDPSWIVRPNPAVRGSDDAGYRNPRVPQHADVVTLGDSQTYGASVPIGRKWPRRLESLTGQSTYNLAHGGFGPAHSRLQLDAALALRPSVVFVAVYSANDLFDTYTMVHQRGHFPELLPQDAEELRRLHALDVSSPFPRAARTVYPRGGWLSEHSRVYGLGRAIKTLVREARRRTWSEMKRRVQPNGYELLFDRGGLRTVLTPRWRGIGLRRDDGRIREGERLVLALLTEIDSLVRAAGARCIVVFIPTKELVLTSLPGTEDLLANPALAQMVRDEAQLWTNLESHLARSGVQVMDTRPALVRLAAEGTLPYQPTDDGHLSIEGQMEVARLAARALRRNPRAQPVS